MWSDFWFSRLFFWVIMVTTEFQLRFGHIRKTLFFGHIFFSQKLFGHSRHHRFSGQINNTALCLKNIEKINRICVWKLISLSNFHRICVLSVHAFQYIDIPHVTASYGTLFNFTVFALGIFIHYYWPFMSKLLYLNKTFTDCVSVDI